MKRISMISKTDPARIFFAERQQEYQASYRAIPGLEELCDRYGDRENRRVYVMSRDVEGKWMAMHERATGAKMPLD
jgi:hypothetical protein